MPGQAHAFGHFQADRAGVGAGVAKDAFDGVGQGWSHDLAGGDVDGDAGDGDTGSRGDRQRGERYCCCGPGGVADKLEQAADQTNELTVTSRAAELVNCASVPRP